MHSGLTDVTPDQHHARDHFARHADGGPDAIAIDGPAASGTSRTLGVGALNAAAGNHDHAAAYEAIGSVTTHANASDPHTGYVREADANWVDLTDAGQTALHSHAGGGGELVGGATAKTVASGTFDATGLHYVLLTGEGGVSDTLNDITGGVDGQLLVLEYGGDPPYGITLDPGGGSPGSAMQLANKELNAAELGELHAAMLLVYSDAIGKWLVWTQLVNGIQSPNGLTEVVAFSDSAIAAFVQEIPLWTGDASGFEIYKPIRYIAGISPAQLTANTDNWNPTGASTAGVIRASTDASRNLTGIAGGGNGRVLILNNIGAQDLVLVHDATSTAANRFYCPGNANLTLTPNASAILLYDSTSSRWRVIAADPVTAHVAASDPHTQYALSTELDATKVGTIVLTIDGGDVEITTGIKGDVMVEYNCTINSVTMLADISGSMAVDIWKDTYSNYPPTVADSITASAKPTITTATKSQDSTLTGWNTAIAAGSIMRFNVDSVTDVTRLTLILKVTKT